MDGIASCQGCEGIIDGGTTQRGDARKPVRRPTASGRRFDIDDRPAAQRSIEILIAQDEAVADRHVRRFGQHDVCHGVRTGFDGRTMQQADPALAVAGCGIDVNRRPVTDRTRKIAQHLEFHGCVPGRVRGGLGHDPVASGNVIQPRACHIEGDAVTLDGPFGRGVLHEQPSYAQRLAGRRDCQAVIGTRGTRHDRAGGYHPDAPEGEHAVHGEAECPVLDSGRVGLAGLLQV